MLTVYGIETNFLFMFIFSSHELQQCLPFTVLKPPDSTTCNRIHYKVATVLTVYGIETLRLR